MGLFSKKEKKRCPICGSEMGFFSSVVISDGEICEACEKMVRGQFEISEYWRQRWGTDGFDREDYKLETYDPLPTMTVAQIREMVESKKAEQQRIIAEVGSTYPNVAKVESGFRIAPGAMDVGIKKAKLYRDKLVCTCLVVSGELKRGDEVVVSGDGPDKRTTLLEVIKCSNSTTFETELCSNINSHKASAGESAWILVDMTDGICEGCLIQK